MASLYKKPITVRDPKMGEKVKAKSKKWWGRYRDSLGRDRRVPLSVDKQAAQAMLNELVNKTEREKAGLVDPVDEEMKRPIKDHLADFRRHKESKNNTPKYIRETMDMIQRTVDALKWRRAVDITAHDVEKFLADLRNRQGLSIQTSNHYLRALKGFTRWMVKKGRLRSNPLDALQHLNSRVDRRHDRRALSQEEFARLLEATEVGPPVEGLIWRDRAILYILAAWTGLRRGEIGSLTLRNFRLDTDPPTVTVEAAYSKHRREDVQVLHLNLVERFKEWLEHRRPMSDREILFPINEATCGIDRRTSKMMRADVSAARRAWIAEPRVAADDLPPGSQSERSALVEEVKRREASDFLLYKDSDGKYADFHALRHTFITNLCKANVSPKTAQALARHSDISLTMNVYTHVDQEEQAAAINKLPEV
jgi:integrase/recombinase XerD